MLEELVAIMTAKSDPQAMERLDGAMEAVATRETDLVAREILTGLRQALAARKGALGLPFGE
jgi:hypothetical protein